MAVFYTLVNQVSVFFGFENFEKYKKIIEVTMTIQKKGK